MNTTHTFYQESGKIKPSGYLFSILILFFIGAIVGYLYSALVIVIPFIYLNFLLTVGAGFAIGFSTLILSRKTHNRNAISIYLLALFGGLCLMFFQWITHITWAFDIKFPSPDKVLANLDLFVKPGIFFSLIQQINAIGTWQLSGIQVSGIILTLIWIVEALIIMGLPLFAVYKCRPYPYSENNGKWYPRHTLHDNFEHILSVQNMQTSLQTDPIQALSNLNKGSVFRYSKIHVYYHPEETDQYISVDNFTVNEGKKSSAIRTNAITNFRVNSATAQQILQQFPNNLIRNAEIKDISYLSK